MDAAISRRSRFGRVAQTLIVFQFLAVMALPLALCCCLEMTAEAAAHDSHTHDGHQGHDGHGGSQNARPCPHHRHAPADDSDGTHAGCSRLVQLVLMLSGLIGLPEPQAPVIASLSPTGTLLERELTLVEFVSPVATPPPRA